MLNRKIILDVQNLSKKYQDTSGEVVALDNINFSVYENEFVSIVGPSGCGKSTILSILSGIDKMYSGNININKNLKTGYMLQYDALFPWKTILDNCLLGLKVANKYNEKSKEKVVNLLKKYGLGDFINKYPISLSGGMKQRVALIRTLSLDPDILLLDEPLSALDSQSRISIGEDIFNIIKSEHKTAIMVTHDLSEALCTSDRVIVLSKRPSHVKSIYEVPFNNLAYSSRKLHLDFNKLENKIWGDLDVN